ncbi:NADH-quinone oxidoreductase subunit L [Sulfurimonas lithotrophica]|uniref:NADH-quinone oxidoreductase subunit L n=1 Tax=Sulfurimonas lithotrophica TaxID=2590022 RepID=A0A5P8P1M9_9BACT|nr:NADH-quinone oxidoreductase subunit L [Sulfurimonas lithotrophica]QFR49566.1 NADH-quinone oxidoreductase subunit L [Sulfurimonas lithotrophica]
MLSFIVIIPFLSAFILALIYLSKPSKQREMLYSFIGVGSIFVVSVLSLLSLYRVISSGESINTTLFNWISIDGFIIPLAFSADALSAIMIGFISSIGLLIHIYASGYMRGDAGFGKFFAYFNLFMGSMLLLVLANTPIIMFIGWELVGLSSYLLIGYYHTDGANIKAANKAFILNRVGDFGFIMGILLLFLAAGTNGFTFLDIKSNISMVDYNLLAIIGVLLFVGAMGKSAQIPLYVWLPDAMAGPTPVSALIHAATMVTAGVYMVARFSFIYELIPNIGEFIASIGVVSALFAAIIASYQSDIKKILAYSTMSQLGYMFIAVGLGFYDEGIFHVFTHAFFKALLFMGAGAVIIAMHHEQNIFKMGGLKKDLKLVYITMFIATLAISGIPPFAGFFSKDAILVSAFASGYTGIWILASLTAALTSYYMFRLLFVVFHSKENTTTLKPLSSSMTIPLVILALGATFAGFIQNSFSEFLNITNITTDLEHSHEIMLELLNVVLAIVGMAAAYKLYALDAKETKANTMLKKLVINKFYIDEIYEFFILKSILKLSKISTNILEPKGFDGFIRLNVWLYRSSGFIFSKLQNGLVRYYALYMLLGISAICLYLIIKLGV